MPRLLILFLSAAVWPAMVVAAPVSLDWAYVGNAGNAADPDTGRGAVSYNYAISKYEVTNSQYAAFLNAVDPTGANARELYNSNMAGSYGGIVRQLGNSNGAKFVLKAGREQNPVNYVSFYDAMRFTNWLHNGQGVGDTETGAYTISNTYQVRAIDAKYWIPSEDEWYKAAYHDASAGVAGMYFDYAIGSNSVPVSDQPGDNPAAVNYYNDDGVANGFNDGLAVSATKSVPLNANPLTDVGAYYEAVSPYGTFDQNGNVWEWNETIYWSYFRVMRGGSWGDYSYALLPDKRGDASRGSGDPTNEFSHIGFRVATVPEPSAVLMGPVAAVGLLSARRRC